MVKKNTTPLLDCSVGPFYTKEASSRQGVTLRAPRQSTVSGFKKAEWTTHTETVGLHDIHAFYRAREGTRQFSHNEREYT